MRTVEQAYAEWQTNPAPLRKGLSSGWMRFAADLHERLLRRLAAGLKDGALALKTDLFEEAGSNEHPLGRMRGLGWRTVGMDYGGVIGSQARERLERQWGEAPPVFIGDARRLPLRADSLDMILSNSTLDHFGTHAELDTALREVFRTLKPGGFLALTLDNPVNPALRLRNALPAKVTRALRITRFYVGKTYGLRQAEDKLSEIGFQIADKGTALHVTRFFAMPLMRVASKMEWSGLEGLLRRLFLKFEVLGRLPTAQLTGHYIFIAARKPAGR